MIKNELRIFFSEFDTSKIKRSVPLNNLDVYTDRCNRIRINLDEGSYQNIQCEPGSNNKDKSELIYKAPEDIITIIESSDLALYKFVLGEIDICGRTGCVELIGRFNFEGPCIYIDQVAISIEVENCDEEFLKSCYKYLDDYAGINNYQITFDGLYDIFKSDSIMDYLNPVKSEAFSDYVHTRYNTFIGDISENFLNILFGEDDK